MHSAVLAFLIKETVPLLDVDEIITASLVSLLLALIVGFSYRQYRRSGQQKKLPQIFWVLLGSSVGLIIFAVVVLKTARVVE